jgi:hypothetical protein
MSDPALLHMDSSGKWVWNRLCSNQDADLDTRSTFGPVKPATDDRWSPSRILRSAFLNEILTRPKYRNQLAERRILIRGAWFRQPIDLDNSAIPASLYILRSRFDGEVRLTNTKIADDLGFYESFFAQALLLNRAVIDGGLNLDAATYRDDVEASRVRVQGNVTSESASFSGRLYLDDANVDGAVLLDGAMFAGYVSLIGTTLNTCAGMDATMKRW